MKNQIIMNCQGHCPFCGKQNLEYSKEFLNNDNIVFPWKCEDCGASGREVYYLDFLYHENCEKDDEFIAYADEDKDMYDPCDNCNRPCCYGCEHAENVAKREHQEQLAKSAHRASELVHWLSYQTETTPSEKAELKRMTAFLENLRDRI